jgi:hypothetical protein
MSRGKTTCKVLKEVRRKIAEANGIPLQERECTHTGDCAGTCPYCESEVRYLERELSKRRSLGKAVAVAGIAVAAVMPAMAQTPIDTVKVVYEAPEYSVGDIVPWQFMTKKDSIWSFPVRHGSLESYLQIRIKKDKDLRKWVRKQMKLSAILRPHENTFTLRFTPFGIVEKIYIGFDTFGIENEREYNKLYLIFKEMPPWELIQGKERPDYNVLQEIPLKVLR